ncbi:tonB-system energizer ExbB [Pokkaliibacter plantistimulans]|nr:tonB-system energizer ExbB [Pokkaliibacter plantistimulans]
MKNIEQNKGMAKHWAMIIGLSAGMVLAPLSHAESDTLTAPVTSTSAPASSESASSPSSTTISAPASDAVSAADTPMQGSVSASEDLSQTSESLPEAAADSHAVASMLPHDLTPMGMFMAADWVVKSVMLGLAFASIVTWTIALVKSIEIAAAKKRARRTLRNLGEVGTLREALKAVEHDTCLSASMVQAAEYELVLSAKHEAFDKGGVKERVESRLHRIEAAAARRINVGTGVLATIGSTSPFVGLFGTVWGIMNSFIGISKSQTTNLAVVAPGIAEALLATAIGLVAAIPAVVIYNHFARSIGGYRAIMADTTAEVARIVSRDLDRQPQVTPLRKVGS